MFQTKRKPAAGGEALVEEFLHTSSRDTVSHACDPKCPETFPHHHRERHRIE
jgi:hypothetical protein